MLDMKQKLKQSKNVFDGHFSRQNMIKKIISELEDWSIETSLIVMQR